MTQEEYNAAYAALTRQYVEKLRTLDEEQAELWFEKAVNRLDREFAQ